MRKINKATQNTYNYLKKVGQSDRMIFGHQNEYFDKAGNPGLSPSDTKDVTGSYAGVFGIDGLSLFGFEYSAARWNAAHSDQIPETSHGNIEAAAAISNEAIENGSIITLSAHMPDFAICRLKSDYSADLPLYEKYDYFGYTPNVMTGDPVNNILPGEPYNEQFRGYMDAIAEYASMVHGAIFFRPFHENTGSWFWWGENFCTEERFRAVYRYATDYLTQDKGLDNLITVYSPGSEPGSPEDFGRRYPGDDYVDMVGFDMYDRTHDDAWMKDFRRQVEITDTFAKEHGLLFAVTETGIANDTLPGDDQTALLPAGNRRHWYMDILESARHSSASYYLLWADFSQHAKHNGYYIPYVDTYTDNGTPVGHELIPDFLELYNSPYSIFADEQKKLLLQ